MTKTSGRSLSVTQPRVEAGSEPTTAEFVNLPDAHCATGMVEVTQESECVARKACLEYLKYRFNTYGLSEITQAQLDNLMRDSFAQPCHSLTRAVEAFLKAYDYRNTLPGVEDPTPTDELEALRNALLAARRGK